MADMNDPKDPPDPDLDAELSEAVDNLLFALEHERLRREALAGTLPRIPLRARLEAAASEKASGDMGRRIGRRLAELIMRVPPGEMRSAGIRGEDLVAGALRFVAGVISAMETTSTDVDRALMLGMLGPMIDSFKAEAEEERRQAAAAALAIRSGQVGNA